MSTKKSGMTFADAGAAGTPLRSNKKGSSKQVTFGAVTVPAPRLQPDIVRQNVLAGQSALERAVKQLLKPGVTIRPTKDVPLYYVDEHRPKVIIRELNGQKAHGVLRSGKFELIDE